MLFYVLSSTILKKMWKLFVKANDKENILHLILELNIFYDIHALIDWSANVTVIKHDQKGLPEERLYMVPERRVHNGEEGTAAGGQNWEITFSSTCVKLVWGRETKTDRGTGQTDRYQLGPGYKTSETCPPPTTLPLQPQWYTFSRKAVSPKSSIISPNSAPNWGPNI